MRTNRGFMLVEVVVYLALFSVLMAGAVLSLYSVESSVDSRREAAAVASELDFVEEKLAWELVHTGSLSHVTFDPQNHAILLDGELLTSENVAVDAFQVTAVTSSNGVTIAYDIRGVLSQQAFTERLYLP
ncbi:MAG TPA: prepilin-type N-terminal cleavage/methylation domain-containing protein [Candidatus Paceibacterota bacterium]|nr:prepilin-type N-terminal cleavage/methylation domain-containing protein [Candidatus Paceibacterota bacterium]